MTISNVIPIQEAFDDPDLATKGAVFRRVDLSPREIAEAAKRLRVDICEFRDFDDDLISELWNLLLQVELNERAPSLQMDTTLNDLGRW